MRGHLSRILLLAALALVALAAPASASPWTPVRSPLGPFISDATADGSRVLVLGLQGRRLVVTTLRDRRVVRSQAVRTSARLGLIRNARVLPLPGGAALVVWDDGGRIASAYRPSPGVRFGPPRVVSRHAGAALGAARGPAVATGPGGGAVVAWWGGPAGGRVGIWAAELQPGGTWSAPREISAGTYPVLDPPSPPVVSIGAAASPDGGFAIAWRQPDTPGAVFTRPSSIVAATRSPAGAWSAPVVLGHGSLTSFDLPVVSASAGTLVTSWADSRTERPDGVTTSTCLVSSVVRPGATPATTDVSCRAQYSPGRVRLVAASDGGVLAAWQVEPDFGLGSPLRAGIEIFRLVPGATSWTFAGPAVSNTLGYWDLDAFAARPGGGALLLSHLSQTVRQTTGRQVRAVVIADDGTVERRIEGPRSPRLLPRSKHLFAFSGTDRGLLVQDRESASYLLRLPGP